MFLQDRETDCDLGRAMTAATSAPRTSEPGAEPVARRSGGDPTPAGGGPRMTRKIAAMLIDGEYEPSAWDWVAKQVDLYESSGGTKGLTSRALRAWSSRCGVAAPARSARRRSCASNTREAMPRLPRRAGPPTIPAGT